jgi:ribosome-associated toxin RatA of RatAB toxin-antitoxin module
MRTLRFSADIARPVELVFEMAADVERHPSLIPDYLSCRFVASTGEAKLVERTASIRGRTVTWRAWMYSRPNTAVHFVHQGGLLNGMQVTWQFQSTASGQTHMTITQAFHVKIPVIGALIERWVFTPKLSEIGQRVIASFKAACESYLLPA